MNRKIHIFATLLILLLGSLAVACSYQNNPTYPPTPTSPAYPYQAELWFNGGNFFVGEPNTLRMRVPKFKDGTQVIFYFSVNGSLPKPVSTTFQTESCYSGDPNCNWYWVGADHTWIPSAPGNYTLTVHALYTETYPEPPFYSLPAEAQVTVVDKSVEELNSFEFNPVEECFPQPDDSTTETPLDSQGVDLRSSVTVLAPLNIGSSDLLYLPVSGAGQGGSVPGIVTLSVQGGEAADGGVEDRPVMIVREESQDPAISIKEEPEEIEFRPGQDIVVRESSSDQLPDYVILSSASQNGLEIVPTPPIEGASPLSAGGFAYGLSVDEEGSIIVGRLPDEQGIIGDDDSLGIIDDGELVGIVDDGELPDDQEGIFIVNDLPGSGNIVSGILHVPSLTEAQLRQSKPLLLDGVGGVAPRIKPIFIPTSGPMPGGGFPGIFLQAAQTGPDGGLLVQKAILAPVSTGGYALSRLVDEPADKFQVMAAAQADCTFQSGPEGGIAPCTLPPGFLASSDMPGQLIVGFTLDDILAGNGTLVDAPPPPACAALPTDAPAGGDISHDPALPTPTNTPFPAGIPMPTPTNTPLPPPSDEEPTPTRQRREDPSPTDCPIDRETGEERCR